jgi:hypothetical protein
MVEPPRTQIHQPPHCLAERLLSHYRGPQHSDASISTPRHHPASSIAVEGESSEATGRAGDDCVPGHEHRERSAVRDQGGNSENQRTWQLSISALPRIRPITSVGRLEVNPVPARIDGPIRFMQVS